MAPHLTVSLATDVAGPAMFKGPCKLAPTASTPKRLSIRGPSITAGCKACKRLPGVQHGARLGTLSVIWPALPHSVSACASAQ